MRNNISAGASWSTTRNAVGNASIYNPETGVTVYKPMNINGNWDSNAHANYSHTLGPRQNITLGGGVSANYSHSVDFHTVIGQPERSLVKNLGVGGSVSASYQFKNGSTVNLGGSTNWRNSRGDRDGFREISAMNYNAYASASVEIPWNIELRTSLHMSCNSGYEVAEMNEAQWLWNISATKSILSGNLIFKLEANDILGQVKPYSIRVNAQGRYETWTNTMRRYAMLSVIYRFNKHPGKSRKLN
ncbi:MAG: outer membrane beta-barrel family protein [Muribaculaceae bacterium]|nr:outer membrane beta-barrel family protein [Muribaculaceae bacterium]